MTTGIFNRSIFNNSIFNTGAAASIGHSGWYRIALTKWQKDFLKEYHASLPKEEEAPKIFKETLKVKENKDGSVVVKPITKPRQRKEKIEEDFRIPDFKPTPLYLAPTLPNYSVLANDILGDLPMVQWQFKVRAAQQQAANDEEDDLLILMLAA